MQITIINDCLDQNAKLRQITRTGSLFKNCSVNCFGVKSDLEASGFLVDAIDAFSGKEGIIMANVAPRNKEANKWKNGTPFGFFWNGKTLIISSVGGLTLSLVRKLGTLKDFCILDIAEVLSSINDKKINENTKKRIINSQFRSFDFLPMVARWIIDGKNIPFSEYDLSKIPKSPNAIWFVDNFGNMKTTLLKEEINLDTEDNGKLKANGKLIKFKFYNSLGNIPDKTIGLVVGSSGIGGKRFLEIIFRGGNAGKKLNMKSDFTLELL